MWDQPVTLRANRKVRQDDGAKAHRFSKFCSTYFYRRATDGDKGLKALMVYYFDESNNLTESVGVQDSKDKKWYWKQTTLLHALPPKTFLAVTQRGESTLLIFRNEDDDLCLIRGYNRKKNGLAIWTDPASTYHILSTYRSIELISNGLPGHILFD